MYNATIPRRPSFGSISGALSLGSTMSKNVPRKVMNDPAPAIKKAQVDGGAIAKLTATQPITTTSMQQQQQSCSSFGASSVYGSAGSAFGTPYDRRKSLERSSSYTCIVNNNSKMVKLPNCGNFAPNRRPSLGASSVQASRESAARVTVTSPQCPPRRMSFGSGDSLFIGRNNNNMLANIANRANNGDIESTSSSFWTSPSSPNKRKPFVYAQHTTTSTASHKNRALSSPSQPVDTPISFSSKGSCCTSIDRNSPSFCLKCQAAQMQLEKQKIEIEQLQGLVQELVALLLSKTTTSSSREMTS